MSDLVAFRKMLTGAGIHFIETMFVEDTIDFIQIVIPTAGARFLFSADCALIYVEPAQEEHLRG